MNVAVPVPRLVQSSDIVYCPVLLPGSCVTWATYTASWDPCFPTCSKRQMKVDGTERGDFLPKVTQPVKI